MIDIKDLLIFLGAFLGSFKSQTLTTIDSKTIKILNVMIGIYAGCVIAFHYLGATGYWVSSIIALVAASLSVALIDVLFKMVPEIAARLVEKYLGIDDLSRGNQNPQNHQSSQDNQVTSPTVTNDDFESPDDFEDPNNQDNQMTSPTAIEVIEDPDYSDNQISLTVTNHDDFDNFEDLDNQSSQDNQISPTVTNHDDFENLNNQAIEITPTVTNQDNIENFNRQGLINQPKISDFIDIRKHDGIF